MKDDMVRLLNGEYDTFDYCHTILSLDSIQWSRQMDEAMLLLLLSQATGFVGL